EVGEGEQLAEERDGIRREDAHAPHARINFDVDFELAAGFARGVFKGAGEVEVIQRDGDILAYRLPDSLRRRVAHNQDGRVDARAAQFERFVNGRDGEMIRAVEQGGAGDGNRAVPVGVRFDDSEQGDV